MKKALVGPKYYIAGPMTGHPEHNYPYFDEVTSRLREQGYDVVSPHEIDYKETPANRGQQAHSWYLRRTLLALLECDAIILLDGWRTSRGAVAELQLALAVGLKVYFYNEQMSYPYELP